MRKATLADIPQLKQLYFDTITTVNSQDYNAEQIAAWAATAEKTDSLANRIQSQYFYVVENQNRIIGFASIEDSGYLDLMYVHKDYQRKGVASVLLNKLLQIAKMNKVKEVTSEVSITAKPFFESKGFVLDEVQIIKIGEVGLINYKMKMEIGI